MSVRVLDALFAPRSIAIIGASSNPNRTGARVLRALRINRFEGGIHLVSPNQSRIGDSLSHASIGDVPETVDLAAICVRAENVPAAIRECGHAGVRAAVVFADGFDKPELRSALKQALSEARTLSGLRMLGPNTVGVRNTASWTYVTFSWRTRDRLSAGRVATITQSGGMGTVFGKAMLRRRHLGPRYAIDTGNEFDVDVADCITYCAGDPEVSCISVIIEGFRDGRRLVEAVRGARALGKPVVFLKSGRSQAAMEQVSSHTGGLAGRAEVFDAALSDAGACVVRDEGELTDAVVLFSANAVPKGRRIGVVTASGGYGILTIDAIARYGMELPQPLVPMTPEEQASSPDAHPANPFDMGAGVGASVARWQVALNWMAAQPNIDAIAMWHASYLEFEDEQQKYYPIFAEIAKTAGKPILCCGLMPAAFEKQLMELGIPVFDEPTRLIRALSVVAPPASDGLAGRLAAVPSPAEPRTIIIGAQARDAMSPISAVLPHVTTITLTSAADIPGALRAAGTEKIILKVECETIAHKTELGLVSAPVRADEVAVAYEQLDAKRNALGEPSAPIVLQSFETGIEIALGGYDDPIFGAVVMVALGGIYLEIFRDTAFALAPVTKAKALQMITSLKACDILRGARGREPADIEALAASVEGFSRFFAENIGRYREIDINPLMVRAAGRGVAAVDILLVEVPASVTRNHAK